MAPHNNHWCAAALAAAVSVAAGATHSVVHLSVARRNVAMAATSNGVVVAGGCLDAEPGVGAYSCLSPSAVVDVVAADASTTRTTQLPGGARAWASACAVGDDAVVVAGGGTTAAKSAAADLVRVASSTEKNASSFITVSSNASALSQARWGVACATAGSTTYFAGGIGGPHSDYLGVVDACTYDASASTLRCSVAPFELSQVRESMGAVSAESGGTLVSFLGGWNELLDEPNSALVDSFDVSTGERSSSQLSGAAYWPGGARVAGVEYAVDNGALNARDSSASSSEAWTTTALPAPLSGPEELRLAPYESGGAIPSEHVPQNGVTIGDCLACFYGDATTSPLDDEDDVGREAKDSKKNPRTEARSPAVHCFNARTAQWLEPLPCSARHKAGGIAAIGDTIFVAGGYDPDDPNNAPTDVVDVFANVAEGVCA